ncbi:alpha-galactosidase [Cohnella sp. GCM10020058]|uniref:alpha-galactosidase n=1 Tax=Cohnella sp. GCM10020058 TaxID=3317330 RepID=UPI00364372D1
MSAGLSRLGLPDGPTLSHNIRAGSDFVLQLGGVRFGGRSASLRRIEATVSSPAPGIRHHTVRLRCDKLFFEVDSHTIIYEEEPVFERWITVRNAGEASFHVERINPLQLELSEGDWRVLSYRSDWGAEFEPEEASLGESFVAETRWGRSSKGMHPWVSLVRDDGALLHVSPMWSGNWKVRCERREDGGVAVAAGLNDWAFFKELAPGETMESPHVAVALGSKGDLHTVSIPLARIGRRHWYPRSAVSDELPVEWNHWFSYEDQLIDEDTFRANAAEAAKLGFEACTLDAGWFGDAEGSLHWHDIRGDWDKVNAARFPSGIGEISKYVRGLGMRFGFWCEIEGLGPQASLAKRSPSFPAIREGEPLGYVCLGNPEAREWAYAELDRLIRAYRCEWIKLDFNVDPKGGCDRCDHGHGPGDGLYEHIRGLYDVLDRLREAHPDVLLENCSSGGLRLDLGMARHSHASFLSDPDWPEHSLQIFWGVSTFLAADRALHWSYSDWICEHPRQRFDPHSPTLTLAQFDYYTRIGMLGAFGVSQRLPDLPAALSERLARHAEQYRTTVRRFVRSGDLYRLTEQPLREGRGSRWAAFQYALEGGGEHLLFVFRLDGDETRRHIMLRALEGDATYELEDLDGGPVRRLTGVELMAAGLLFADYAEEQSGLFVLRKVEGGE